jgi:hypothetical protein
MMACGAENGVSGMLDQESAYALSGMSMKCQTASCPSYTGVFVWLIVVYGFFLALLYAFRPHYIQKANAVSTDPNSPDFQVTFLYALLYTAIVVILVALFVRCMACRK